MHDVAVGQNKSVRRENESRSASAAGLTGVRTTGGSGRPSLDVASVDSAPVRHSGVSYKFPFDTQKKDYAWWDPTSKQAPPAIKGKESQTVQLFDWKVPMTVDGASVEVDGLLQYTPTGSGSAWLETGITVGLPLIVIGALGWWSVRSAKRRANRVAETS